MSGPKSSELTRRPDPRPVGAPAAARRARWVVGAGLAAIVGAAFWSVLHPPRVMLPPGRSSELRLIGIGRPFPAQGRFASDPYIGSKVCAECHPGESALHARSGHSRTLLPAGRLKLARRLDGTTVPDPETPGVTWSYRYDDGRLRIARRAASQVEECIAEYAFGSGHHGTTFVSVIDPKAPSILEHRLTYYTREDLLDLTPGHAIKPPPPGMTPHGGVPPPYDAWMCFACHSTQVAPRGEKGIDESRMIPNVTCERCHGPGRAHVEAARRGAPESELTLPLGTGRWTAARLLQFCGDCHRHPAGPRPDQIRPDDPTMARFQPIGLMQSRCYKESNGALSCLTCHDAHARVSSDRRAYDAVCVNCHGGSRPAAEPPPFPIARGAECPVAPEGRCVECHMPRTPVDTGRHILMSDHWIRVHREGGADLTAAAGRTSPDRRPSSGR